MFKMSVLNQLLIDAKADFVAEVDIHGNTTFLAYLDKDIEPTVYYFNVNKNGYAQPYYHKIYNSVAEAQLDLYSQYLCLYNNENTYRCYIFIPSLETLEFGGNI